jgi:hypothetical protein
MATAILQQEQSVLASAGPWMASCATCGLLPMCLASSLLLGQAVSQGETEAGRKHLTRRQRVDKNKVSCAGSP